jgi:hypothetical protein
MLQYLGVPNEIYEIQNRTTANRFTKFIHRRGRPMRPRGRAEPPSSGTRGVVGVTQPSLDDLAPTYEETLRAACGFLAVALVFVAGLLLFGPSSWPTVLAGIVIGLVAFLRSWPGRAWSRAAALRGGQA